MPGVNRCVLRGDCARGKKRASVRKFVKIRQKWHSCADRSFHQINEPCNKMGNNKGHTTRVGLPRLSCPCFSSLDGQEKTPNLTQTMILPWSTALLKSSRAHRRHWGHSYPQILMHSYLPWTIFLVASNVERDQGPETSTARGRVTWDGKKGRGRRGGQRGEAIWACGIPPTSRWRHGVVHDADMGKALKFVLLHGDIAICVAR